MRCGRAGRWPKLLVDLGVTEQHMLVTGGNVIELAAGARRDELVLLRRQAARSSRDVQLRVTVVQLDEPDLDTHLTAAIRAAWKEADRVREPLRSRADEQIHASRHAFEQVFQLVEATERTGTAERRGDARSASRCREGAR